MEPILDENNEIALDERNFHGLGKVMPGGPTCHYNNTIPCRVYVSESGGITAKILIDLLKTMDGLNIFPCDQGIQPVLIVDGHKTRLHYKFLQYINQPEHKWHVCLGVPYATSYWQVGDSHEQNGNFKSNWYRAKRHLMTYKND